MRTVHIVCLLISACVPAHAELFHGGVFPAYTDPVTHARVYNLTPGEAHDQIVYQTHPMWTPGMKYLVVFSDRGGGKLRPHAISIADGAIKPILEKGGGNSALSMASGQFFYLDKRALYSESVEEAFAGCAKSKKLGELPDAIQSLTCDISVGPEDACIYVGACIEPDKTWGVYRLDLARNEWRELARVDFKASHIQARPAPGGGVMFCHETGGDAPQRIWYAPDDGSGAKPLYKETYDEWVTHETWWGPDRILFTVSAYDQEHERLPHGLFQVRVADTVGGRTAPRAGIDITGPDVAVVARYRAWHTQGSPDGKWILGDDMARNLWLIRTDTNERRLLTQGHRGDKKDPAHPHASFTPDSKGILFNSSRNGNDDLFVVEIPAWDTLPKP